MVKISTICRQHTLFLLVILCSFYTPIFAQQITWTGSVDTDWDTPGNWNTGTVPTASDDVIIDYLGGSSLPVYPIIGANTSAVAHSILIRSGASLANNAAGEHSFTINGSAQMDPGGPVASFHNSGSFENKGKMVVNAGGGAYGILNNFMFFNNSGASIAIDNASNEGFFNDSNGQLHNSGNLVIGAESSVGVVGLHNKFVVSNSGGEIRIDNAQTGILHENSAFRNNNGSVIIGASGGMSVAGFVNNGMEVTNQGCGRMIIARGSFVHPRNHGFRNNALLQINGLLDNEGDIYNQGILKYGTLAGSGRLVNEWDLAVSFTNSSVPIFSYGGTFGGEISIFQDEAATISAGNFIAPNTFQPNSLPAGSQILYAKIQPYPECTYIVPFTYEMVKMNVKGNGVSIASGSTSANSPDHTDFGSHFRLQTGEVSHTFTIENTGSAILELILNPPVQVSGGSFIVKTQPATSVNPGQSTTFEISFIPVPGEHTATVSIASNDPDANPYNFAIKGFGTETCATVPTPTGEIQWTGLIDSEWNNPCNWSPASVPGAGNDVVIPRMAMRPSIHDNIAATARSIELERDASLSILPLGSLTVNGRKAMSAGVTTAFYNAGHVDNRGKISLGHQDGADQYTLWNDGLIFNTPCSSLLVTNGVVVNNANRDILNDGLILIEKGLDNQGNFTNNGVLKYGSLAGSVTNESDRSVIVMNERQPFFVYGSTYQGTIDGIFRDAEATVSAGTFTAPNTFVPNGLPTGSQTLYTKITPPGARCSYMVPISYTSVPGINVIGNGAPIASGDHPSRTENHTDFVSQFAGGGSVSRTFTIESTGKDALSLTGSPLVAVSSPDFTVTTQPDAVVNTSTTFTITFDPSSEGPKMATVTIPNTSADKNPYTFNISGMGLSDCTDAGEVAGTITWTGFTNSDWNNPCNWYPTSVPRASNDVVIAASLRQARINSAVEVKTMEVLAGASLAIADNSVLTVAGEKTFRDSRVASFYNAGTIENMGKMVLGKTDEPTNYGLVNAGTFYNLNCATLHVLNHTFGSLAGGSFINMGFVLTGATLFNDGTFTNNGVVRADEIYNGIQNQTPASVIVRGTKNELFDYGSTYNGKIDGIFHDEAATLSAGTFAAPNNFVPVGDTYENKTLYAKITPAIGSCTYMVPFRYTYQAAKMTLTGNSVAIPSGHATPVAEDHTDFGAAFYGSGTISRSFYIESKGNLDLELTGNPIISLTGSGDFVVTKMPGTLLYKNIEEFTILFDPLSSGTKTAVVSIANNDTDKNPYTFTIRGEGTDTCTPVNVGGTLTWTGAVDNNWDNPCNWSPFKVPENSNDVSIGSSANPPVIYANTQAVAGKVQISNTGSLKVAQGAALTVSGSVIPLYNSGIIVNEGRIRVDPVTTARYGLMNEGEFSNKAGAELWIDKSTTGYLYNTYETSVFNNAGLVNLGTNGRTTAVTGIVTTGIFTNATTGIISVENTNDTGITIGTTLENSGQILIGENSKVGYYAMLGLVLKNKSCGRISAANGLFDIIDTKNEGLIDIRSSIANTNIFTNNGVLVYGSLTGNAVVNASKTSVIVQHHPAPIFAYGNSFDGTVLGIFKNREATEAAGTFTAPNTFVPGTLPVGSQTLYAKILLSSGSCEYIVPFTYVAASLAKINIQGNDIDIINGSTATNVADGTDFGTAYVPYGAVERYFTVQSSGNIDLELTGDPLVKLSGSEDFQITEQLGSSTIYGVGSVSFKVTFDPSSPGIKTGVVTIESNDASQPVYTFTIQGEGTSECVPVDTPGGEIVWTGATSAEWNEACNWAPNSVPRAGNHVTILGSTPFSPLISAETSASILSIDIQQNAKLEIADQATLTLTGAQGRFPSSRAFMNAGLVKNNGKLTIESADALAEGLANQGEFQNTVTGEIEIDKVVDVYLFNSGTFTNEGTIRNGTNANSAELAEAFNRGLTNTGNFENGATGVIVLENNGGLGLVNVAQFINKGQLTAGGGRGLGRYAILNDDTFRNEACGTVTAKTGTFLNESEKMVVNEGLILLSNNLENNGTFSNGGILKYGSSTGYTNVSTDSQASLIVNDAPYEQLFTYGRHEDGTETGAYNGTIDGIFTDENASVSAGTFTAPNSFVDARLPEGEHMLYARITPASGMCSFIVPFKYVSLGAIAWTGTVDSDWNNAGNWSNAAVPGTETQVRISGGTPHSPVIMAGTEAGVYALSILENATLRISAEGSLLISGSATINGEATGFANYGSFENEGELSFGNPTEQRSLGIYNTGTIENKTGGIIHADFVSGLLLENHGTFTNAGKWISGVDKEISAFRGILNFETINNLAGGEMTMDNLLYVYIYNGKTLNNAGKIALGSAPSEDSRTGIGISNEGELNNAAEGVIGIDRTYQYGFDNDGGTTINDGLIAIGLNAPVGERSFVNRHIVENGACGTILVHAGIFANNEEAKVTNKGFVYTIESIQNEGEFDNQGILKFPSNTGLIELTTSSKASVIVNDAPAGTIFTYGDTYDGTIDGIFKDVNATQSAGTFRAPNVFQPKDLPSTSQTLYAKITPAGSSCSRIVPFTFDNTSPMPVTLVSFSGKKSGDNENVLKWVTSEETNFDRFEIQRSSDAKSFETIGTVRGDETKTASIAQYQFTDRQPVATSYYRLKMVDKDATFEYSKTISISGSAGVEEVAVVGSIYPNPARGNVFVDILSVKPETWKVTLVDMLGRVISSENRSLGKGINTIKLENLVPGLNVIRFENGHGSVLRKVVKP